MSESVEKCNCSDPVRSLHFAKLDQARAKLDAARADLGHNLGGYSITDLLADNFPWSLEQCKQIAQELT